MPTKSIVVRQGDIGAEFYDAMRSEGVSAWDIETDGLDVVTHQIQTCQVFVPGVGVEIVQMAPEKAPLRLMEALTSERTFKLFHHAPFDLRFMRKHWGARPRNVGCTKVASKIVAPQKESHSLAQLTMEYLGVELDKSQRLSDWSQDALTPEQLEYAANDVVFLLDIYGLIWKEALNIGVGDLVEQSFDYLPARVETDLRLAGDVFAY